MPPDAATAEPVAADPAAQPTAAPETSSAPAPAPASAAPEASSDTQTDEAPPARHRFPTIGEALLGLSQGAEADDDADEPPTAEAAAEKTDAKPSAKTEQASAEAKAADVPSAAPDATPAPAPVPQQTPEQIIAQHEAARIVREAAAAQQAERQAADEARRQRYQAEVIGPDSEYQRLATSALKGETLAYEDQEKLARWTTGREHLDLFQADAVDRVANHTTSQIYGNLARQVQAISTLPGVSTQTLQQSPDFSAIGRHLHEAGVLTGRAQAEAAHAPTLAAAEAKAAAAEAKVADLTAKLAEQGAALLSARKNAAGRAPQPDPGGRVPTGRPVDGPTWDPTRPAAFNLEAALAAPGPGRA